MRAGGRDRIHGEEETELDPLGTTPLERLLGNLAQGNVAWDLGGLVGCLLIAYGASWLVGRRRAGDSGLFGRARGIRPSRDTGGSVGRVSRRRGIIGTGA